MEFTLKSNKSIIITATRGNKLANWTPSGHHYRVTVKVKGSRKSHTFDFWASYADMIDNKPADLRGALSCFASDALLFGNSRDIDDFASNLGEMKPSEAIRAYEGCKKSSEAANRLGLSWDELDELADY